MKGEEKRKEKYNYWANLDWKKGINSCTGWYPRQMILYENAY